MGWCLTSTDAEDAVSAAEYDSSTFGRYQSSYASYYTSSLPARPAVVDSARAWGILQDHSKQRQPDHSGWLHAGVSRDTPVPHVHQPVDAADPCNPGGAGSSHARCLSALSSREFVAGRASFAGLAALDAHQAGRIGMWRNAS